MIPEKVIEILSSFVRLSYSTIECKWACAPKISYSSTKLPGFTFAGRPFYIAGIID